MAFTKILLLLFLPLLGTAKARMLSPETVQVVLKDTNVAKDDEVCQDCIHIIEILKHLLSDEEFQMKLKSTLEEVCDLLPEQIKQLCRSKVGKDLPLVLTFITGLINPGQVCTYLNLCEGETKLQMEDILMNYIQKTIIPPTVMLEASFPCNICTYALNVLDCLLPIAQTESAVSSVLDEVCSVLPIFVSGQCSRLVQRLVKKLFEVLLNAKSPNSICSVLRLCQSSTPPRNMASPLSDCDSCLTLVILSHLHLGSNATQPQVTSFLQSVCQSHPGILPKCESFTQRYGEQLQGILGKEAVAMDVCKRADLCMGSKRAEQGDVGDPCTLGPSYSCRDLETAHACGVVSFCQMNMWK
ncbi:prosaposin isoform X2 [Neoarius graeffei]|uniref:prosaposin isoform X2 n=1 Tax=Neoarius graeffei TaxID=443677 RepID=UPI00298C53F0|nr:prosaposin isoform X2 [Neoarius graeffei]